MKKGLLSLFSVLVIGSAIGQTNGELSGNQATGTAEGYLYNFNIPENNDADIANCTGQWDIFPKTGLTVALDGTEGYLNFMFDGTQAASDFTSFRLSNDVCGIQYIDVSAAANMKIQAKVRASVAADFRILMAVDDGGFQLMDKDVPFSSLVADDWTTITIDIPSVNWADLALDLTKGVGMSIQVQPTSGTDQPVGMIEIDWVAIGDADAPVIGLLENSKINTLAVYPNPVAEGTISLGKTLENIQVMDATGMIVKTIESADQIEVSDLESGIYMMSSSQGYAKFIKE